MLPHSSEPLLTSFGASLLSPPVVCRFIKLIISHRLHWSKNFFVKVFFLFLSVLGNIFSRSKQRMFLGNASGFFKSVSPLNMTVASVIEIGLDSR